MILWMSKVLVWKVYEGLEGGWIPFDSRRLLSYETLMKKIICFFVLGVLSFSNVFASVSEPRFYYGTKSGEVHLKFEAEVEIQTSTEPTSYQINLAIKNQLQHMFGSMAANRNQAVPKGDQQIEILGKTQKNETSYTVNYRYLGTVLMDSAVLGTYEFNLPINPETIYSSAMVLDKNPCTDAHYQGEGDFWYFWNPNNEDCPLQKDVHYKTILALVERVPNTPRTFPEYAKLVDKNGVIKMSLFFGMDDPLKSKNPSTSKDINAQNFRDLKRSLLLKGYENTRLTDEEIIEISHGKISEPQVTVETFKKVFELNGKSTQMVIQLFFGPTGINENNIEFHHLFKDALENSSVMIYDGHSGLGGHLDLASIEGNLGESINFDSTKYQIYFFNSCSSYSYYNSMYFDRKKSEGDSLGISQLDILTNGLSTYFYVLHETNLSFIDAVEIWAATGKKTSYQELAQKIDSENLFGVNGDEDNPVH